MHSIWQPADLEQVSCDFCSSNRTNHLIRRPDGLQVVECTVCRLAYLNPRPKPELVSRFYDESYFANDGRKQNIGYASEYVSEKNHQSRIDAAESKLHFLSAFWEPAGKSCLEVGCATGEFLHVLNQYGATVTGIDVSEFIIAQASRSYSLLDFRVGNLESLVEEECFDAIFAFEVIEHVLSPAAFLRSAHRLLQPGGLLILSTPNLDCGRAIGLHHWLGFHTSFEHLYFFSPDSLNKLGQQQGFTLSKWFAGCGSGIFPPPVESRVRTTFRAVLERTRLLPSVRSLRRRVRKALQDNDYRTGSSQHNLLVILEKR